MALILIGKSERDLAEWRGAREAYQAAFPLRAGWDRMRWYDSAEEYAIQRVTFVRGWRDLQDPHCPGYESNQRYLAQRAKE